MPSSNGYDKDLKFLDSQNEANEIDLEISEKENFTSKREIILQNGRASLGPKTQLVLKSVGPYFHLVLTGYQLCFRTKCAQDQL